MHEACAVKCSSGGAWRKLQNLPDLTSLPVAHRLLGIIYHVLRRGEAYRKLGGDYFAQIDSRRAEGYHIKRLTALGYQATLTLLPESAVLPGFVRFKV
jgi:hypothetical protein